MDGALSLPAGARVVLPADVAFLDPEEHIFAAMLEGWRRQQQSRALRKDTITGRLKVIARFHAFTDRYRWQWTAQDAVDFGADLSGRVALSTLRQYQCAGRLFSDYITDPRYEWVEECTRRFGAAPIQIWDEWNTAAHTSEFEGLPARRPLTFEEIQHLFDYADSRFAKIRADRKRDPCQRSETQSCSKLRMLMGCADARRADWIWQTFEPIRQ